MKRYACLIVMVAFAKLFAADLLPLDHQRQSLTIAGYTFQKLYDQARHRWIFRATKDGSVVRDFGSPEPNELDLPGDGSHLGIGAVKTVTGAGNQVVIRLWTGGNKCCHIYWIVGFAPDFRVQLDTSSYRFDSMEVARDIDGDGDMEFSFGTTTFDYFDAGYAYSPRAHAWFKFDRKSATFVPANDLCFPEIEKQIGTGETKLLALRRREPLAPENQERRQAILDVVLAYLYAGREHEAWAFFDREYRESGAHAMRENVERKAGADPFLRDWKGRRPIR